MKYPTHIEIHDPRFKHLVHPMSRLDCLADGFTWTEGPVWFGDHQCLIFSDIPSQRLMRWSETEGLSTFRVATGFNNGNTRDPQGRLIGCRHGYRDVVRTEHSGALTVLANSYSGKALNSPNDVIVQSDGTIWFTDPTYGIMSNFEGYRSAQEQPTQYVYRLSPNGDLSAVITDMAQPNGLCLSPDEKTLYVAESGSSHDPEVPAIIRKFQLAPQQLMDEGVFAEIDNGLPDGIRTDAQGNLWSSAADGVHCFAPDGHRLGKILVPQVVSNICFGGPDGHRLFITATTAVYRVFIDICGAEPWTHPG
ncbi:SMP-30/gluconolactonase/LRE family protein [Ruegeria sp. 2205SS24-7]|uniref:SMP-30/gluconolactonase/LRE family protein n=1 Tax=Ruegeria discodermiae TaxID=3064389 RepID=UPI0027411D03|nr:SMP-30/gluconolactonase/LRE family protein [Ruegeria sp. 2205SS24-7]MDP5221037.1 SMP-30/gluconolactonase/LRE family protein [Ruegeria sp. 2205SS24-7]